MLSSVRFLVMARAVSAVAAACLSLAATQAEAATILPHRAIYALTLAKEQAEFGGLIDARGKLEFEWADVCDGWSVRQRAQIIVTHKDDSEIAFGWSINSWESKDGLSYRFFIRRLLADGEDLEVRGSAQIDGEGGAGEVHYTTPEERQEALPRGTIFPTQHSIEVIEAVESGTVPLWRVVFDGSGDEGLYGINVALARDLPPGLDASIDSPLLRGLPSWRVGVAYFGMESEAAEPEFEQDMRLFSNGVVDELLLDYGDFTLDGALADLVELPAPDC